MHNKPILTIGIISELLNIHQRTLRIYDKEGILLSKRTNGNRRLYSQNDLEKAKLILYLTRNLALNLSGVKIILGVLKELKIKPSKYMDIIARVSFENKINENANIIKTSKRGRKPKENNILEQ